MYGPGVIIHSQDNPPDLPPVHDGIPSPSPTPLYHMQHMAWPPMLHAEVSAKPALLIQLIHMHDSLDAPPDRLDQSALLRELRGALGDMHRCGIRMHAQVCCVHPRI